MDPIDNDSNAGTFDDIMRRSGVPARARSFGGNESTFERTRRVIATARGGFEDLRPEDGILETATTVYKVVDDASCDVTVIGDIAMIGAIAFERSKNLCIVAPGLRFEIASRISALCQADYFRYKALRVILATSQMQIERTVAAMEAARPASPSHHDEQRYWSAAATVMLWSAIAAGFYFLVRMVLPHSYVNPFVALPFWFRAFYGPHVMNVKAKAASGPRRRLTEVNARIAPSFAVALLLAIVVLPVAIVYLTAAAIVIHIAALASPTCARIVVTTCSRLPRALQV